MKKRNVLLLTLISTASIVLLTSYIEKGNVKNIQVEKHLQTMSKKKKQMLLEYL